MRLLLFSFATFCTLVLSLSALASSYTSVNTSVTSSSNSDVAVGDDVVINGPVSRGRNSVRTVVGTDDSYAVDTWDDPDLRPTVVKKVKIERRKVKPRRAHLIESSSAGPDVSHQVYRQGNCLIDRRQAGSMVKQNVQCD